MVALSAHRCASDTSRISELCSPVQKTSNPFERLVQDIEIHFRTSELRDASLDGKSDRDVDYLMHLMNTYTSSSVDWGQYAYSDPSKNYTRNRVVDLGGKANLVGSMVLRRNPSSETLAAWWWRKLTILKLILVWNAEKRSPIHDHARAHCVMKILQGSLKEEIFMAPGTTSLQNEPLQSVQETTYSSNEVAYICDGIGLHRISNASENSQLAVSLHLYTPPNAADFGYSVYEEKTGKRSFVRMAL